jgi:hypothetical protein
LIRGAAVKSNVRSLCVVEGDIAGDRLPCFADAFIGVQIDFLVLDGSPEALDEDVVSPGGWKPFRIRLDTGSPILQSR